LKINEKTSKDKSQTLKMKWQKKIIIFSVPKPTKMKCKIEKLEKKG